MSKKDAIRQSNNHRRRKRRKASAVQVIGAFAFLPFDYTDLSDPVNAELYALLADMSNVDLQNALRTS